MELLDVRRIWDRAPHSAFTDLVRYRGELVCAFREGPSHQGTVGVLRLLGSANGTEWAPLASLGLDGCDLRDPKLSVTPFGELMLLAGAIRAGQPLQTFTWFSRDARTWSEPYPVSAPYRWIWRVTWHEGVGYALSYATDGQSRVDFSITRDGRSFDLLASPLFARGFPNEHGLAFLSDGRCVCLLRREREEQTAQLGEAGPPYRDWRWRDLGVRVGGPALVHVGNGALVAGVRLYGEPRCTALCTLDLGAPALTPQLVLPSGGDTSYTGLVVEGDCLLVSYYSSHEGRPSIYFARVRL